MGEEKVPKKYISCLEKEDLIKLCEKIEQPTNGSKEDLVGRLQRKVKYNHLTKPMLVEICKPQGIPARETKENMIAILTAEKITRKEVQEQLQNVTITDKEKPGKAKDKEKEKESEKPKTPHKNTSPHKPISEKRKVTPLSDERWHRFRRVDLALLCAGRHLPVSKTKGELIEFLKFSVCESAHYNFSIFACYYAFNISGGFGLEDLQKVYLFHLCTEEGRPFKKRNTVGELLDILQTKTGKQKEKPSPAKKDKEKEKEKEKKKTDKELLLDFAKPVPMTKSAYRNKMHKLGLVEEDQDVFHIIAHANGGADHADNYAFLMGASFNRFIGNRFDHINCYIVGMSKAKKAVEISLKLTSYVGPSAAELYAKGKSDFNKMLKELDSKK